MTCIVGIVSNGVVSIGGDSAGVSLDYIRRREDSKVFNLVVQRFTGSKLQTESLYMPIGFTTSFRMGQILRYSFKPPKNQLVPPNKLGEPSVPITDMDYMCTSFINEVIKVFTDKKYIRAENKEVFGGDFLVGYNGNLYEINADFQVAQLKENYTTTGSGYAFALGSLYMTEGWPVEDRIIAALRTAEHFCTSVSSPFRIVNSLGEEKVWNY